MNCVRLIPLVLIVSLAGSAFAAGPNLYRYKDDKGQTVIGSSIPSDAVQRGYQVITASGRVLETVAPALTPEQIEARDRAIAEQKRQEEEALRRKEADMVLLKTYSHPDDAVRARDRRLQEIDALVRFKQGSLGAAEKRLEQAQANAANLQRSGRAIPEDVLQGISISQTETENLRSEIATLQQDRIIAEKDLEAIVVRVETITGKKRSATVAPASNGQ